MSNTELRTEWVGDDEKLVSNWIVGSYGGPACFEWENGHIKITQRGEPNSGCVELSPIQVVALRRFLAEMPQ